MKKVLVISFVLFCVISLHGQRSPFGGPSQDEQKAIKVSEEQKEEILNKVIERIKSYYIVKDKVPEIVGKLRKKSAAYEEKNDAYSFSRALTKDLRDITNDFHFGIIYNPRMFSQMEQMMRGLSRSSETAMAGGGQPRVRRVAPGSGETARGGNGPRRIVRVPGMADGKKRNYYLRELAVLKGNVGYLRLERMPSLDAAKKTVDSAMGFLGNTDALIIDLRNNPGGIGGFIPYFMSYFFPAEEKLLYSRELSIQPNLQKFFVELKLPNKRLDNIPIYILINKRTGSAAANLAYTMQKHDRAKLVGVTAGKGYIGAHSASPFPLSDNFLAIVPVARVVHAKTKSNWNITGVVPDIPTEGDAKEIAHREALKEIGYEEPTVGQQTRRMRVPNN